MSYRIKMRARDGHVTVETVTAVPDGSWEITGSLDPDKEELSVTRRDHRGRWAGHAAHSRPVQPDPAPEDSAP